ncbi:cytochrome P450 family protein [Pleurotus pulmonarius]
MLSDYYLIFLALLFALVGLQRWRKTRFPLPPGPSGYPIVGNLFDMPSEHHWVKYLHWSKEYKSDIIYLRVLGRPIIVLNSYKAANDLLDARSSLYSDSTMATELLGWKSLTGFIPYGRLWYSRDLLRRLLESPERFLHHVDHILAATIISTSYGLDVEPEHDPNVERAERALVQLKDAGISGTFVVDILPLLRYMPSWMPGAGFKRYAERARLDTVDMRESPYQQGREGKGGQSILSRRLAKGGYGIQGHPDEELIKDIAWVAYTGGAETSHLALSNFFAAMVLYPKVQKKGQEELTGYLGSRLPAFEDLPHLPYVRAMMLELLRWQSVLPLGLPHRLTMDDEYNGYFLPKGSAVFVNIWALLRDEEIYPDPDTFDPERFLKNGEINPDTLDPIPNFGFGRRICPGRFFAMDSLFISIASILSCFDITKVKDKEGRDIEPDIQWTSGFSRHIIPFECSITPRSTESIKIIRDSELM